MSEEMPNTIAGPIGTVLIAAGTAGGVMAASRDPIHAMLLSISVSAMILGIALRRIMKRRSRTVGTGERIDIETTEAIFGQLLSSLGLLSGEFERGGTDREKVLARTGPELSDRISTLQSALDGILADFETAERVRISVLVSEGERYLNRMRSALSDGYEDEAALSLKVARERLEEARALAFDPPRIQDRSRRQGPRTAGDE
jgi:hypothetical protein